MKCDFNCKFKLYIILFVNKITFSHFSKGWLNLMFLLKRNEFKKFSQVKKFNQLRKKDQKLFFGSKLLKTLCLYYLDNFPKLLVQKFP